MGLLEVTPHNRNAQGIFNTMRDNKRLWEVSYEVYGQNWRSSNFLVQLRRTELGVEYALTPLG